MSLIVILAGLAAFLSSVGLLATGLTSMGARYFIATAIGYVAFLVLIRVWLWYQRNHWFLDQDIPIDAMPPGDTEAPSAFGGGGSFGGGGASRSFDAARAPAMPGQSSGSGMASSGPIDGGSVDFMPDVDEAWPLAVGVVLLLAGALALGFVVYASPVLFAEVLLDATVAGAVYRRARHHSRAHWLQGVVRRTWLPATTLCAFVALAGFALQASAPSARSLGGVIEAHSESGP